MIRLLRRLLSLPLLWLGRLTGLLRLPVTVGLLKAAWTVGRDGQVGRLALVRMGEHMGRPAARAQAARWLARWPCPEIAAWAGLVALEDGDTEAAAACLSRGREIGDDPGGMLELLELMLAYRRDDAEALRELAASLERRRDLSPVVRKLVLEELMWQAMLDHRLEEAGRRARFLLEVEDNPAAHMVLWALAKKAGRVHESARHLAATEGLSGPGRLYYRCLANLAIGETEEAGRDLAELRQRDQAMAGRIGRMLGQEGDAP